MWKNIWHKENSAKRPNKNFPLQKHFSSTKNFKGQKQQLRNGVWTSNHTKVKIIYYSLWWSTFFPIFTRFAYQNDFLNLGVAILLLVAVALYMWRRKSPCSQHSSCMCIFPREWHIQRRENGAGKSRSQPLQSRNAHARAQTKREVRQEKETAAETSQSQKERKKETVRPGKAGEQSEKCQEKANGPSARDSLSRLALRRDRTSPWWFWKVCDFDVTGSCDVISPDHFVRGFYYSSFRRCGLNFLVLQKENKILVHNLSIHEKLEQSTHWNILKKWGKDFTFGSGCTVRSHNGNCVWIFDFHHKRLVFFCCVNHENSLKKTRFSYRDCHVENFLNQLEYLKGPISDPFYFPPLSTDLPGSSPYCSTQFLRTVCWRCITAPALLSRKLPPKLASCNWAYF